MATLIAEAYQAFIKAGVPEEDARGAAEASWLKIWPRKKTLSGLNLIWPFLNGWSAQPLPVLSLLSFRLFSRLNAAALTWQLLTEKNYVQAIHKIVRNLICYFYFWAPQYIEFTSVFKPLLSKDRLSGVNLIYRGALKALGIAEQDYIARQAKMLEVELPRRRKPAQANSEPGRLSVRAAARREALERAYTSLPRARGRAGAS